ncbi:MAG TPA: dihydrokaempferol 4-reductase [Deltaproteobacteria bacterium]|nr:dihydrokaempferol 4-reductase [Deltaproteobacteria bacterium]
MQVALTGASGFLGRHTVVALVRAGHTVTCISRRGTVPDLPEGLDASLVRGVSADVLDVDALEQSFEGAEVVVHGAGFVSNKSRDARRVYDVHVRGTQNAMAAARGAGAGRFVLVSTSGTVAVGSDPEAMYTEDSPRPIQTVSRWPYYRTKLFAEEAAFEAADNDLAVVAVNPTLLLGPDDDDDGASTHSVRTFIEDGMPVSPPGGLAFVDVRDAAEGIVAAVTRGRAGHRYLLNGCNLTFFEFFRRLARLCDQDPPMASMPRGFHKAISWIPGMKRDGKLSFGVGPRVSQNELDLSSHFWYCSWNKAQEELGWTPRDPSETLSDTVHDLLTRKPW